MHGTQKFWKLDDLVNERKVLLWVIRAGILMPFAVALISCTIGHANLTKSISAYYFSVSRDLFVMTLTAAGLLLIAYPGRESAVPQLRHSRCEFWVSNLAGIAAFLIPLFPMTTDQALAQLAPSPTPAPNFIELTVPQHGTLHLIAAAIFFGLAMVLAFLFSRREARERAGQHFYIYLGEQIVSGIGQGWNSAAGRWHNISGLAILVGLAWAALADDIYLPEIVMLLGFCSAWTARMFDKHPLYLKN